MVTRIKIGPEVVPGDDSIARALNVENSLGGNLLLFPLRHCVRGNAEKLGKGGLGANLAFDSGKDVIHMSRLIHRQLSHVNPHLIACSKPSVDTVPMPNTPRPEHYTAFKDWLEAIRKHRGLTRKAIADIAGRSAQAATKWFQGGDIEPEPLERISTWAGVPYADLRLLLDGQPLTAGKRKQPTPIMSPIAQRIARKAEHLDDASISAVEVLVDTLLAQEEKRRGRG